VAASLISVGETGLGSPGPCTDSFMAKWKLEVIVKSNLIEKSKVVEKNLFILRKLPNNLSEMKYMYSEEETPY
jgi:hypothetical protein